MTSWGNYTCKYNSYPHTYVSQCNCVDGILTTAGTYRAWEFGQSVISNWNPNRVNKLLRTYLHMQMYVLHSILINYSSYKCTWYSHIECILKTEIIFNIDKTVVKYLTLLQWDLGCVKWNFPELLVKHHIDIHS